MKVRLYLDEDTMDADVVRSLRIRGVDVTTALECGMIGRDDLDHLRFAALEGRVLYSFNVRDYHRLHAEFLRQSEHHGGILLARQQTYDVGEQMRRLLKLIAIAVRRRNDRPPGVLECLVETHTWFSMTPAARRNEFVKRPAVSNDSSHETSGRSPWLTMRYMFLVLLIVVIGFVATRFFQTSRTRNAVDVLVGQNAYISMRGWHRASGMFNNVGVGPGPNVGKFLSAYSMLPGASVAGVFLGCKTHPPVRDVALCIAAISEFDEIESLGLYDPQFRDDHLQALHAPKLDSLYLTGSSVTGAGLRHLERFPRLQRLELTGLNIRDADLSHVRALRKVHTLKLQLNKTQIGDDGVVHLLSLDSPLQIDLSDTNLSDKGLLLLAQLKNLTQLNVTNTQVTAEGVRQFQKLRRWCPITSNPADDVDASPASQQAESH